MKKILAVYICLAGYLAFAQLPRGHERIKEERTRIGYDDVRFGKDDKLTPEATEVRLLVNSLLNLQTRMGKIKVRDNILTKTNEFSLTDLFYNLVGSAQGCIDGLGPKGLSPNQNDFENCLKRWVDEYLLAPLGSKLFPGQQINGCTGKIEPIK